MATKISFFGDLHVVVRGDPEMISRQFRDQEGGPVQLTTKSGHMIFANWSNVVYFEETSDGPVPVSAVG